MDTLWAVWLGCWPHVYLHLSFCNLTVFIFYACALHLYLICICGCWRRHPRAGLLGVCHAICWKKGKNGNETKLKKTRFEHLVELNLILLKKKLLLSNGCMWVLCCLGIVQMTTGATCCCSCRCGCCRHMLLTCMLPPCAFCFMVGAGVCAKFDEVFRFAPTRFKLLQLRIYASQLRLVSPRCCRSAIVGYLPVWGSNSNGNSNTGAVLCAVVRRWSILTCSMLHIHWNPKDIYSESYHRQWAAAKKELLKYSINGFNSLRWIFSNTTYFRRYHHKVLFHFNPNWIYIKGKTYFSFTVLTEEELKVAVSNCFSSSFAYVTLYLLLRLYLLLLPFAVLLCVIRALHYKENGRRGVASGGRGGTLQRRQI